MPVSIRNNGSTRVFLHTCEQCGDPAVFGFGVDYRAAMNLLESSDKQNAKIALGRWWCGMDEKCKNRSHSSDG